MAARLLVVVTYALARGAMSKAVVAIVVAVGIVVAAPLLFDSLDFLDFWRALVEIYTLGDRFQISQARQ
jgi:hypothetical protein